MVRKASAPGCSVTYTRAWEGGNGFGANLAITNLGDAITNGWTLRFTFAGTQQVGNGWPVSFSQAGQAVTVASNAPWNAAIASGATVTAGFNGTVSGPNVASRRQRQRPNASRTRPFVTYSRPSTTTGWM